MNTTCNILTFSFTLVLLTVTLPIIGSNMVINSRMIFDCITITTCIFGCIWQLWSVCEQFLNYSTTTVVTFEISPNITPPGVAVCVINVKTAFLNYTYRNYRKKTPKPIGDYDKHTPSIEEVYSWMDVFNPNSARSKEKIYTEWFLEKKNLRSDQLLNNSLVMMAIKQVSDLNVCYTFKYKDGISFDMSEKKDTMTINLQFYAKKIISDPRLYLRLYLLNTIMSSISNDDESIDIKSPEIEGNYKHILSYDSVKTHRLPSPYQTQCIDYGSRKLTSDNCWSRKSCIDQCIENELIQKYGQLYHKKLHDSSAISSSDLNRTFALDTTYYTFKYMCLEKMSSPDCDTLEYFRYITNTKEKLSHNETQLVVAPSYVPLINIVHQESITLVDFLIYVLGTLSFWLCLSPFNNLNTSYDWLKEQFNRRSSSSRPIVCIDCCRLGRRVDSLTVQIDQQKNGIKRLETILINNNM